MAEPHLGPLKRFNTIGALERRYIADALRRGPLSGYIGGDPVGGYWVTRLSEEWGKAFQVPHVIPCNSATSGLLAACMAVGISPGDTVWTTPYSMSATAACAEVLRARVRFVDIEDQRFGIDPAGWPNHYLASSLPQPLPKAIIATNLFGHPAYLQNLRTWCDKSGVKLIEDNAQAPMAMENGRYAGTVGHIGVFSLNVHKHIQCGEGGVIVTSNDALGGALHSVINHGELGFDHRITGLNLRMCEPTAAVACAQLSKAKEVIEGRRQIGLELCDMVKDVPWIRAHGEQPGCKHVYYLWTALVEQSFIDALISSLHRHGVPIRAHYAPLLNKLFKSSDQCPVARRVDDSIIVFEVCAFELPRAKLDMLREIMKRATGALHEDRAA